MPGSPSPYSEHRDVGVVGAQGGLAAVGSQEWSVAMQLQSLNEFASRRVDLCYALNNARISEDFDRGGGGGAKKGQNMTECVPVPSSEHVAEIVGRQGCKIKSLRAKTNTYIKTPVRGDEPVFVVTGRKEDVVNAKKEIMSAADHFSSIRATRKTNSSHSSASGLQNQNLPGQITQKVEVPYKVVGLVVGPKGATIKRIQQTTKTYIVTPSREKDPVFEVTGLPEDVERAKHEIESHISSRTGSNFSTTDDFHSNGYDIAEVSPSGGDIFKDLGSYTYSSRSIPNQLQDFIHVPLLSTMSRSEAPAAISHNMALQSVGTSDAKRMPAWTPMESKTWGENPMVADYNAADQTGPRRLNPCYDIKAVGGAISSGALPPLSRGSASGFAGSSASASESGSCSRNSASPINLCAPPPCPHYARGPPCTALGKRHDNFVCVPCGHTGFCMNCNDVGNNPECPVCSKKCEQILTLQTTNL